MSTAWLSCHRYRNGAWDTAHYTVWMLRSAALLRLLRTCSTSPAQSSWAAASTGSQSAACNEQTPPDTSRWNSKVQPTIAAIYSRSYSSSSSSSGSSGGSSSIPGNGSELLYDGAQAAAAEAVQADLGICNGGAYMLDLLHTATGLPWWAVLPLTTFTLKTLLLPLSLRQAAVVRSHITLWAEAHNLLQQQAAKKAAAAAGSTSVAQPSSGPSTPDVADLSGAGATAAAQAPAPAAVAVPEAAQTSMVAAGGQPVSPPASPAPAAVPPSVATQLQQLTELQARLGLYHTLRRQCEVPHPVWLLGNNLIQWPVFVYTAATVRRMALAAWPGFSSEGALWFPDLTLAALVLRPDGSLLLPMGWAGLVLPLGITAMMLTSIRIGFKAAGTASQHPSVKGTWMASLLQYMQPALYALTLVNTVVKVQLPYATLLHWGTSSGYTLGLQAALKHPKIRALLGRGAAGGSAAAEPGVDPGLVTRVAANQNANVLVVIAAQQAAAQRYSGALYCLGKALELDPANVRAHYSQGQVYALTNNWQAAADSYQAAAAAAHVNLSKDPAAYGQTLYCLAIAQQRLQQQEAALTTLEEASQYWPQPYTLALCKAHCLEALGRVEECVGVVDAALAGQAGSMEVQSGAVRQALVDLKQKLVPAAGQS